MFYCSELLSLRRRGKLARCWLAATFSEKQFKKICKPSVITGINVCGLCEEILTGIEVRNTRIYGRISLYLSSQLMYGIVRIHFYQTVSFQHLVFEAAKKLECFHDSTRRDEDFDVRRAFDIPEDPINLRPPQNVELSSNLHVLRDEPYSNAVEYMMQDAECLNFGALTDEEMVFLLADEISLKELERIRRSDVDHTMENPLEVPLIDFNGPDEPGAEKDQTVPLTPRKRSRRPSAETPSKRSKLLSQEVLAVEEQFAPPAFPEAQDQVPPAVPAAPEVEEELQPVGDQRVPDRSTRNRRYIDVQIRLSDRVIQSWFREVRVHTRERVELVETSLSARQLLGMPSTRISGELRRLFDRNIRGTFRAETEELSFESQLQESTFAAVEAVRHETIEKSHDPLAEMSSKVEMPGPEVSEVSKTILEQVSIEQLPEIADILAEEASRVSMAGAQRRNGNLEFSRMDIGDSPFGRSRVDPSDRKQSISSLESRPCLTTCEILALLEILWREKVYVTFEDVFSPDSYGTSDAATAFRLLLKMHKERRVVLKQAAPFESIYVEKYQTDTSSSND